MARKPYVLGRSRDGIERDHLGRLVRLDELDERLGTVVGGRRLETRTEERLNERLDRIRFSDGHVT